MKIKRKIKIKWWFVVIAVVVLLLVSGNVFQSKVIEKKEIRNEQLSKDVVVYRNNIVNIHKENLVIFKDNKEIKKRFDKLKKEKEKIKVIVKTEIIKVNKKLYVPKAIYDNLETKFDELAEECSSLFVNVVKLELNEKKMQATIDGLNKATVEKDSNKDEIIKILKRKVKRRISFGVGVGSVLTPDGKVYYGGTISVQYRIF